MDTARFILEKNVFFEPMQVLSNLINENVTDINSVRATDSNQKARQWLFPTTPEANDENYPRVALIPEQVTFGEFGAGRWLQRDTEGGDVLRDKYGRVATVPITIGVFCKKDQKHKVVYFDGTVHMIQNSKQSDFLGYLIANRIEALREKYFIPKNMDIKVNSISTSYEDNEWLWAKTIEAEIVIFDVWSTNYSAAEIIKNISLAFNTVPA